MATKTSINRKEVFAFTNAELAAGRSKQSIFEELSQKYFDSKRLATYIASVPNPELRERYKTANSILFVLLVIAAVGKIFLLASLLSVVSVYTVVFAVPLSFVTLWLAAEVRKMRGYIYRILVLLPLVEIGRSIEALVEQPWWGVGHIVLLLSIAGLSWFLSRRLFPTMGWGRVQQDASGNYQF